MLDRCRLVGGSSSDAPDTATSTPPTRRARLRRRPRRRAADILRRHMPSGRPSCCRERCAAGRRAALREVARPLKCFLVGGRSAPRRSSRRAERSGFRITRVVPPSRRSRSSKPGRRTTDTVAHFGPHHAVILPVFPSMLPHRPPWVQQFLGSSRTHRHVPLWAFCIGSQPCRIGGRPALDPPHGDDSTVSPSCLPCLPTAVVVAGRRRPARFWRRAARVRGPLRRPGLPRSHCCHRGLTRVDSVMARRLPPTGFSAKADPGRRNCPPGSRPRRSARRPSHR